MPDTTIAMRYQMTGMALASQALLAALTEGKAIVDESTMRTAVTALAPQVDDE